MSINKFMKRVWNEVKNNEDWLEEKVKKKYLEVSKLHEELYGIPFTGYNALYLRPHDVITGSREELRKRCVQLIRENLSDLNSLLGTKVSDSDVDMDEVVKIGFVSDPINSLLLVFTSLTLTGAVVSLMMGYPLLVGMCTPLGGFGGYFLTRTCERAHYDPVSNEIYLYNRRRDLFNPKYIERYIPIHEACHFIIHNSSSPVENSPPANEGIAAYSHKVILGKYSRETDLDVKILDAMTLDSILMLINREKRNELMRREFNAPPTRREEKKLFKKIEREKVAYKGYTSILFLVDKYGEGIIRDIVNPYNDPKTLLRL